ncbi:hypothetical protein GCM10009846_31030 [Agrococcus versicolor]|uniref:Anti-sigma K factor RskA C-terminal domain-containing protein n=1 Tax=Agrococcus versicolor TaxID=501482 RepID=A0ABP5MPX7_9MICO
MQHIPHDDLAWRAASRVDGVGPIDEHLRVCQQCADDLAALQRTVSRFRVDSVEPVVLPPGLWDRIAAEVATVEPGSPAPDVPDQVPAGDAAGPQAARAADPADASGDVVTGRIGGVDGERTLVRPPRRGRRRRFSGRALLAACAVTAFVIAGGVGIGVWASQRPPADTVLASVPLEPLTDGLDGASAEIVERDGHRVLVIDADVLPTAEGGYLDVWLIDPDVVGMVNLGILDGTSGEYVLPDDLDLDEFPIVDVSIEQLDGDPTHSGDSVWRGTLA